ncbi:MAG: hypothetical protein ACRESK_07480, partial [Gammaproteobacteria bacterium]
MLTQPRSPHIPGDTLLPVPTTIPARKALYLADHWLVWLSIAVVAMPLAHADQCEYFDEKSARMVETEIRTGDMLLHYCEPCDMAEPLPLRIRDLRLEKEEAPLKS